MRLLFFVGTYTEPIHIGGDKIFQGKGKGVYLCAFDGERLETLARVDAVNPSYVCVDEEHRRLYAVGETKTWQATFGGSLSQWRYDESWRFEREACVGTGGTDPCHVAISPDGRWLALANYASGTLTAFPRDGEGRIRPEGRRLFQHEGGSVHPVRQQGPHAHSVVFTPDSRLFAVDLGKDALICYRQDAAELVTEEALNVQVTPGSGPRFGEFSADGRHFYLITEMGSTVTHFAYQDGRMARRETLSTLPADFQGTNYGADVHLTPNGRFLYASNRGHDSLAIFRVGVDGELTLLGHQPCGGHMPRNFAIDPWGQYLLVGNQLSDSLTAFRIEQDGKLSQVGDFAFPTPVCIRFLTREGTASGC